jgi:hypothetical protein
MLASTEGPRQEQSEVLRRRAARFTVAGAPDLEIQGAERARYRGDHIELLEITLSQDTLARLLSYATTYVTSRRR